MHVVRTRSLTKNVMVKCHAKRFEVIKCDDITKDFVCQHLMTTPYDFRNCIGNHGIFMINSNELLGYPKKVICRHGENFLDEVTHDGVIKWNNFRVTGPLWGEPPVTVGFPSQRPETGSFDVFFDMRPNKRLSKQSRHRWLARSSPPSITSL